MKRRGARGFTLVELTVALLAGLIVAMGIVGLSREATRTFHEEVRSSAAEATLRTAVDRLRTDLQRAAFMSTGNISGDPSIAKAPGQTNWANIPPGMNGLRRLASIRLQEGGSLANGLTLSAVQNPALAPDAVEIGGNMTSAEQFWIDHIQQGGSVCGGQRLVLAITGAVYRLATTGNTQPAQELNAIFQPATGRQFIVRVVDVTGRQQFVMTCAAQAAGFVGPTPYVDIDPSTPILTPQQTQTEGGLSALGGGFVNPVQIVRWEIDSATTEAQNLPQYATALDNQSTAYGTIDPNKYDLVRVYMDAADQPVWSTAEIVAEYAVDLDFAFSVDQGTSAQPRIVAFGFDDPNNALWATDVSAQTAPPYVPGPQRIREVRVRVATRTQLPDRTANVPAPLIGGTASQYLLRYCVNTNPSCSTNDGTPRWARVRTVTAEVALPNQARFFW
jgi:type II secretory pathway pseudopilin PulG